MTAFPISRRAVLLGGLVCSIPAASAADSDRLTIVTRGGQSHVFTLELANTPEARSRGLMFRRELAPDKGMLFEFGARESEVSMWMKNTYISLDMVFIRADGTIRHIAENTTPLSEATISSGGPVRGVLEVIGGTAKRLGIAPGDRVEHPYFQR
ncbi:DUF192 domain-containing protein [Phreatobacter aquaticus]|uniref:DUF192 domain-containing protein n=1 Tax=Phreatobacter aquaticus TaxID=2570229 RepID=A0A4D7QNN0_9HYPH|nr:DUF192 domain-containing protein [Phreatobacter aquaticus]QCK87209.1 DUF192 domain-containing protein [Phreatobacter aquaticus]